MNTQPRRRRFTPVAIITGLLGSLVMALSLGLSLAAYTASINNTVNTASTSTLAITETGPGGTTCNSFDATTTCAGINKYGGTTTNLNPGDSRTVTVNFANRGNLAVGTSTLAPTVCVATPTAAIGSTTPTTPNTTAGNLCSVLQVRFYKGATTTTPLYNGPLSGFTSQTLGALPAGANQDYNFVITLPAGATTAIQGQQVQQELLWTFNQ